MAQFTTEQVKTVVANAIRAAGGAATHDQVIEALEVARMGAEAKTLLFLVQSGTIRSEVVAQPNAVAQLRYTSA